eukprot:5759639-Amphidinium_carterae.1
MVGHASSGLLGGTLGWKSILFTVHNQAVHLLVLPWARLVALLACPRSEVIVLRMGQNGFLQGLVSAASAIRALVMHAWRFCSVATPV